VAGCLWTLYERWPRPPVLTVSHDPVEIETPRAELTAPEAVAYAELRAIGNTFEAFLPPRDPSMLQRMERFRETEIRGLLRLAGLPEPVDAATLAWMRQRFQWGVSIGLRKRLYEAGAGYARQALGGPTRVRT
jgi:hypothetical protein